MARRPTAGELQRKVKADTTIYDPLEVGHAVLDDLHPQLMQCAETHCDLEEFAQLKEFCVMLVIAGDPLLVTMRRHKYAAFPFLPKPRPQQSVFIFKKSDQSFKRLWSLPNPKVMAIISEMPYVGQQWITTKQWCDAFFEGKFFELIRSQNQKLKMKTELEFLNEYRAKLLHSGVYEIPTHPTDPFDFSKITKHEVIDQMEPSLA